MKKETILYQAKFDKKDYVLFKQNQGEFNIKLRFQLWVNHLSNYGNFLEFISGNITRQEFSRTPDDFTQYKITGINRKNWEAFRENCTRHDFYAIDVINILVKRFNNQGYCFESKVKI